MHNTVPHRIKNRLMATPHGCNSPSLRKKTGILTAPTRNTLIPCSPIP